MKRPVWKQVLIPTLLLGGLWFTFSSATTIYISWLEAGYHQLLRENMASLRAASKMQDAIWQIERIVWQLTDHALQPPPAGAVNPDPVDTEILRFQSGLSAADSAARSQEEQAVIAALRSQFDEYVTTLNASRGIEHLNDSSEISVHRSRIVQAASLSALCNRLRQINQELIETQASRREKLSLTYGWARIVMMWLGPFIGIWLGFRTARSLSQRLARISVRLEGASGDIGHLDVLPHTTEGDLDELDEQVLKITRRFSETLRELQSAKREIVRGERLAAVGELAAGIAHELRNPLTSVKLLIQTAALKSPKHGLTEQQLSVVQDEIARMERTIQSLLDFARPPTPHRVQHDLRETLSRAINLVQGRAARDQIEILQERFPAETLVNADPEQLHQVFVNLLLNGMDAMPQGGRLRVAIESGNEIERGIGRSVPQWIVTIEDSGTGIPEQVMGHLFEPFVTTKERGTGLGLAVSQRIVIEHSGNLSAANAINGGAVFTIRLPRAEVAPMTPPQLV